DGGLAHLAALLDERRGHRPAGAAGREPSGPLLEEGAGDVREIDLWVAPPGLAEVELGHGQAGGLEVREGRAHIVVRTAAHPESAGRMVEPDVPSRLALLPDLEGADHPVDIDPVGTV